MEECFTPRAWLIFCFVHQLHVRFTCPQCQKCLPVAEISTHIPACLAQHLESDPADVAASVCLIFTTTDTEARQACIDILTRSVVAGISLPRINCNDSSNRALKHKLDRTTCNLRFGQLSREHY